MNHPPSPQHAPRRHPRTDRPFTLIRHGARHPFRSPATSLTLALSLALSACGGGGGGPEAGANTGAAGGATSQALQVATFVDAPVAGLEVQGDGYSGVTDDQGRFHYREGDRVTFRLGNVVLGSAVPAGATVTPVDLAPGATDARDARVLRVLRTLQTLDEDGNPDNGIRIPSATRQRLREGNTLDLSDDIQDTEVETRIGRPFARSEDEAVSHFEKFRDRPTSQPNDPTPPTTVAQPLNTQGRLLASNCFQCHGTGGMGGFERIRGGEASEVFEYLSKPASSDIMAAHAQGYTRAQLQAIVDYLRQ